MNMCTIDFECYSGICLEYICKEKHYVCKKGNFYSCSDFQVVYSISNNTSIPNSSPSSNLIIFPFYLFFLLFRF